MCHGIAALQNNHVNQKSCTFSSLFATMIVATLFSMPVYVEPSFSLNICGKVTVSQLCYPLYAKLVSTSVIIISADYNECEDSPSVCSDVEICINTPKSFQCICNLGFMRIEGDHCQGETT